MVAKEGEDENHFSFKPNGRVRGCGCPLKSPFESSHESCSECAEKIFAM